MLLGIGVAVYYFRNISKSNTYTAGLKSFITDATVKNGVLTIQFKFQNPNTMPTVIRSVVGDVFLNGNKLAAVSSFQTVEIAGNAETYFPVNVKLTFATVVNSIVELTKGFAGSKISFRGYVNANNKAIPVNIDFALK